MLPTSSHFPLTNAPFTSFSNLDPAIILGWNFKVSLKEEVDFPSQIYDRCIFRSFLDFWPTPPFPKKQTPNLFCCNMFKEVILLFSVLP